MIKPTGACTAGVKVRITRQRMVGKIARHSGADTAAGVTPGRPWHSTGLPGKFSRRAPGQKPPFTHLIHRTFGASACHTENCGEAAGITAQPDAHQ